MNSLFPVLMILGSLHGAPVKIDWVTQEEDPTDVPSASSQTLVSSLGLPRASSADWPSVESTVLTSKLEAGETGFPLHLPGESLTTAESFADEPSRPSQTSPGLDGEESSLTLSKRTGVVIGLRVPTTLADTVYSQWTSPSTDALDFTSTGRILPPSSTVSGRSDHEVTTSLFQFASQPAFNSEGTTTLDRKDNSQNTPPPNSTSRSDAMQSLTESSVDGIVTRGLTPFESIESSPQSLPSTAVPSSLGSETAPAAPVTAPVRLRTGAVSWDSTFEELSNSTSIESAGPSSSSESWQDAPEHEPTTSVPISCSPGVSDTSSAASFASITPAPDVGEANSTAASPSFHGATDVSMSSVASLSPDVTNALSSTLLALSQAGYTTSVSIAQDPDVPYLFTSQTPVDPVASPTPPPASGQWLSDVSEYSTALSVSITEALGLSRLLPASQSPETSAYSTTASVSADLFSDASEDPAASRVSTAHVPYTAATHSTAEAVYSDPTLSVTDSYSTSWSPSDAFSSVSAQQLSDVVDYSTTHRAADQSERSTFALPIASGSTAVSVPCSATPCASTLASEIPTSDALVSSWPSDAPEHTVASSVSLVQDFGIFDTYSTSASVYSEQSSDVSERSHNPDVSTYSMSSSPSVLTDVSEYSTAPSSFIHLTPDNSASSTAFVTNDVLDVPVATSRTPDVSDIYSTAVSSDSTQWQSDVSDYSSALSVTSWSLDVWLAGNSKVGTTMVSPHTQQTTRIKATSTEMPGSERHVSVPLTHTSPLSSATLSSTPIWKPFPSKKLFTTSHDDPSTRSPTSIRLSPSTSQPFTKATAVGTNSGTSAFAFELSEMASLNSQTAQSTPGIQAPLLLQFAILNQSYSYSLSDRSSEDYKELEAVVDRTLRAIFHARYRDNFLGIEILGFRNGSVRVECEVVFQAKADVPSSSDIVRTVLTHVYRQDHSPSELVLDASSVACNGYSLANLQPEALLIEFTALSVGFGPWTNEPMFLPDLLQRLSSWVVATLEETYFVREFNIGRVISIQGDVNIQGTALLSTPVHVDNAEVLMLLNDLVNRSVDLRSLRVNGSAMNLGVLPVSFAIESHEYNTTLRDSRSAYYCRLGGAVTRALQAILKPRYSNFVQAVVSHFGHGSVISTCDLMFLNAAPASREVLDIFFNLVNGNGFLTGMDIKVDAYSFTVGDARLERPYQPIHFPGFGIALILLFSLVVISLPVVALLCWKYSFWTTCQEGFLRQQWDLEQNTSLHLPLPEIKPERYRLNETYANYSFES